MKKPLFIALVQILAAIWLIRCQVRSQDEYLAKQHYSSAQVGLGTTAF